jgi:hypothetical protein
MKPILRGRRKWLAEWRKRNREWEKAFTESDSVTVANWECRTCAWFGDGLDYGQAHQKHRAHGVNGGFYCPNTPKRHP